MRGNGKLRDAIMRMMAGRYGFDQYSRFLCTVGVVCAVLSLLTKKVGSGYVTLILTWVTLVLLIWADWRVFSRKLDRRMAENRRYLKAKDAVTGWFSLQRDRFTQRRDYVFFRCPGCRAVTRVPRHKGKLRITCRRCGYSFEKRT